MTRPTSACDTPKPIFKKNYWEGDEFCGIDVKKSTAQMFKNSRFRLEKLSFDNTTCHVHCAIFLGHGKARRAEPGHTGWHRVGFYNRCQSRAAINRLLLPSKIVHRCRHRHRWQRAPSVEGAPPVAGGREGRNETVSRPVFYHRFSIC